MKVGIFRFWANLQSIPRSLFVMNFFTRGADPYKEAAPRNVATLEHKMPAQSA